MNKFKLSKLEIKIILLLLFIGVFTQGILSYYKKANAVYAEITYDAQVIHRISLNKDATIVLEEIPQITFLVKDNAIGFIESDCPDKVCIHQGMISQNGQWAACLPNKTVLRIQDRNQDIDIIAY